MTTPTITPSSSLSATLDRLVRPFGIAAATLFSAFAAAQIALALGAPWGEHFWGGSFPAQLPTGMRFASAGAAAVLMGMATVVLARAGIVQRLARWRFLTGSTWAITAYMALNTIANLTSDSNVERYLFGRATFVMALLTAFVAYRGPWVTHGENS